MTKQSIAQTTDDPAHWYRKGYTALATVLLAPMFLGVPLAVLLVPVVEILAVRDGVVVGRNLRRLGTRASKAAIVARVVGCVFAVVTGLQILANVAQVLDQLSR